MGTGGFGCDPALRHASLQIPPLILNPSAPRKIPSPSSISCRRMQGGCRWPCCIKIIPYKQHNRALPNGNRCVKPSILLFLPCKRSHKFFYPIARESPSAMVQHATEMPFLRFSPSQALSQALFSLFSPKGMLTHSREII